MAFNPPLGPATPYPPTGGVPPAWPPVSPMPQPAPGAEQQPAKTSRRQELEGVLLVGLIILVHTAVNMYWLHADNHLIHLDEAHHIQRTVLFHEAMFPREDVSLPGRVLGTLGIESPYPPLMHMVGAVFIRAFGYTPDTVALTGSLALALLLLGVYTLARQGMTPRNAALTALVASLIPMVYGYSRLVMPDTFCTAFIVWALYALLKSDCFGKIGWSALFGICWGLALLSKQTAVIYLAVPAAGAFCLGLATAMTTPAKDAPPTPRPLKRDLLLNALLCLFVVAALCAWWYVRHLEYLYTWWSTRHGAATGLLQPGIALHVAEILPPATGTALAPDPALAGPIETAAAAETIYPFTSLLEPFRLFWKRYLIYLVNEAAFLPLTLAALLGVPALLLKRNRNPLALLLAAWLIGAYLILTGVFALHSPRFLYGAVPALAFLAVLALNAIPAPRPRRVLWVLFLGILVLQFINLSVAPLGPLKTVEIPVLADEPDVLRRGNTGLVLLKDRIETGRYVIHAPQSGQRVTEAALEAMARYEQARPDPQGAAAWLQVVSATPGTLGVDFYARMPGPLPNPYRPAQADDLPITQRPFVAAKAPSIRHEDTLPELAETEYIILQQGLEAGDAVAALESAVFFFTTHGFESIYNGFFEGYGPAAPGYVHVLARRDLPPLDEIEALFDIYDLLDRDGRNYLLTDEERAALEQRYAEQVRAYDDIRKLTDPIHLLGFHVSPATEDWFLIRLVLHAGDRPERNLRVWMRATVDEGDRKQLPEAQRSDPILVWDFDPEPPTGDWRARQALVLTRPVMALPLRYHMEIGVYDPEKEARPRVVVTRDRVDFSVVPK